MLTDAQRYDQQYSGYMKLMSMRPQSVGFALADSPVGLAAWIYALLQDVDIGATLLRERGPHALTLEALTDAAGRTRGSFYYHFRDRDVFLAALVARWRHETLDARAAFLPPPNAPSDLRAFLRGEPFRLDHSFERALRQLAAVEPTVRFAVDEVDRARIDALSVLVAALRPELDDPASHAFVQYAAMVGGQWLIMDDNDPRLDGIKASAFRLFGLDED